MASPPSVSLQPSRSASVSDSADNLNPSITWDKYQEARLQHCQVELAKAQKRWSASQGLWIEEYHCLQRYEKQVENLLDKKSTYLKTQKKQQAQVRKAVGIWKKRTWKSSRTSSKVDTSTSTPPGEDADDEGEEEEQEEDEEEEDCLSPLEHSPSLTEFPPPFPTQQSSRRTSLSNVVRRLSIAGIRHRRKVSAGDSSTGPSASQTEAATASVPEGTVM